MKLLRHSDLNDSDLGEVLDRRHIISPVYTAQVEQAADYPKFREWAISTKSTELLVEGSFGPFESHHISALSVLCATLTQTLCVRENYISLVFFCGSHVEDDDDNDSDADSDADVTLAAGGVLMIKSLIAQLLEQRSDFELTGLDRQIDKRLVEESDLDELCILFRWLVERLPEGLTVVCIIDGVVHYEIDSLVDELTKVLECLLDLVRNEDMRSPVKVLVTSPTPTESVRGLFDSDKEEESFYLLLDSIGQATYLPDEVSFGYLDADSTSDDSDVDYHSTT
ncbi:hypothetical protein BDP81DRAFT_308816 [Colletotrichum phormii]|uniref:Nephrocystin 3-like N-terminal domain-containing protein n=1 Tax=Colletotrichum phormii TaxID=359342 RepID=A0AAJ0A147_9PEZI|nr:uncharacterized protein BDP81DRAFT_308816 [Colletotrichum phormii]KAK1654545.1 hypothetical protein BDP81DRAFT_308816 [Colletotrichum phormii]